MIVSELCETEKHYTQSLRNLVKVLGDTVAELHPCLTHSIGLCRADEGEQERNRSHYAEALLKH